MADGLKDPIEVFDGGIEVIISDGDVVIGFKEELDGDMGADVTNTSRHENVLSHF